MSPEIMAIEAAEVRSLLKLDLDEASCIVLATLRVLIARVRGHEAAMEVLARVAANVSAQQMLGLTTEIERLKKTVDVLGLRVDPEMIPTPRTNITKTLIACGIAGDDGRATLHVTAQELVLLGRFYASGEAVERGTVERVSMGGADRGIGIVDMPTSIVDLLAAQPPYRMVVYPGTTVYFQLRDGKPGAAYELGFFVTPVD